ncbi:hypothetical protein KDA11_02745 [Candidatus Saccharibacteria bacterium]|nr:hypothetical protein [Candidatus Saccharibacteria bacterium]
MNSFNPDLIQHVPEIMSPQIAIDLGKAVLGAHQIYLQEENVWRSECIGQIFNIGYSQTAKTKLSDEYVATIYPSTEHANAIGMAIANFRKHIPEDWHRPNSQPNFDVNFGVGAAGGGEWHVDPCRDFRIFINLSDTEQSLKVAKKWESGDFTPEGYYRHVSRGPLDKAYELITYNPGDGLLLNNLSSNPTERLPHAGVHKRGKVMLRIIANNLKI